MINYFKNAEGWTKFNQLFGVLLILICFTTIGQLLNDKAVTPLELFYNVKSGKYSIWQYINYGKYVATKMYVLTIIPIGVSVINRLISHKDTLKEKKGYANFKIMLFIVVWLISFFVSYLVQTDFEEKYLSSSPLTFWEELIKLYELVLPALIFTFISTSFTEILTAKKIKKRDKLRPEIENELTDILREVTLTPKQEQHLIRNFRKQVNKFK